MKLTETHLYTRNHNDFNKLNYLCFLSKNLYNSALYLVRKEFCNNKTYLNYYSVNKILYSEEFNEYLQKPEQEYIDYLFDSDLKLVNLSDKNIKLNIVEDASYNDVRVIINYTNVPETNNNLINLFNDNSYNMYQYTEIYDTDTELARLEFLPIPDTITDIELTITTNSKDRILTTGIFNNF